MSPAVYQGRLRTKSRETSNQISGDFSASFDFTFDQFDESLGELTAVYIEANLSYTATVSAGSGGTANIAMNFGSSYEVMGFPAAGGGAGGSVDVASGESETFTLNDVGSRHSIDSFAWGSEFADIYGTGTVLGSIVVDSPGSGFNYSLSGYIEDFSVQLDPGATYTLTYEYTAVPEVKNAGVALGLCSLLIIARRPRS